MFKFVSYLMLVRLVYSFSFILGIIYSIDTRPRTSFLTDFMSGYVNASLGLDQVSYGYGMAGSAAAPWIMVCIFSLVSVIALKYKKITLLRTALAFDIVFCIMFQGWFVAPFLAFVFTFNSSFQSKNFEVYSQGVKNS